MKIYNKKTLLKCAMNAAKKNAEQCAENAKGLFTSMAAVLECVKKHPKYGTSAAFKEYLTLKERRAALAGNMNEGEFKKAWFAGIERKKAANIENAAKVFTEICDAPDVEEIRLSTEWKKNATWGHNPTTTARIWANSKENKYFEGVGTASGCGYDKYSAAVARALNDSKSIQKALLVCAVMDEKESKKKGENCKTYGYHLNAWGIHLEGGVGITCFYSIFRRVGLKVTAENETKTTNFVQFND